VNKDYLEIAIKEDINDFRSKTELRSNITEIRISQVLLKLFENTEFAAFLKKRINT
jgi:hypothetical protein